MVTSVGSGSGASYALGNLAVYTRVSAETNVNSLNVKIESSTESGRDPSNNRDNDTVAAVLDYDYLSRLRSAALSQLSTARRINDLALDNIGTIKDLLEGLQNELTQFTALIGQTSEADATARQTHLDNINLIAENINLDINRSTYKNEALLGGTYSYDGQLTFKTALFGTDLTTLPHFFSLKAEDEQLALGSQDDNGVFSVEVNGAILTESATEHEVSYFSEQITKALSQVDEMNARAQDRSHYLNIRTTTIKETDIEPMSYEQQTLSKTQQVVQGLIPSSDQLLHLNGQIISVTV